MQLAAFLIVSKASTERACCPREFVKECNKLESGEGKRADEQKEVKEGEDRKEGNREGYRSQW